MKIAIIIFIFALVVVGCAPGQGPVQIQVDPDSQEVIAKITARHVGYEIQKKYPDVAKEILVVSENILIADGDVITPLITSLTSMLISGFADDPLLVMDIKDLVALVKIDTGVEITEDQIRIICAIAKGLISGIESYINIKIGE